MDMNPDDLAKILDELGQRLGPAGQHVFELAVRQAYIEAISGTVFLIVTAIATGIAVVLGRRYVMAVDYPGDRALGAGLVVAGFGLVTALAFVNFVAYDLPRFLNPEYAAIRDILGAIGGSR